MTAHTTRDARAMNARLAAAADAIDAAILQAAIANAPEAEPFLRRRMDRLRGVPADLLYREPAANVVSLADHRAERKRGGRA